MEFNITEERVDSFFHILNILVTPDFVDDTFNDTLAALEKLNYTMDRLMFTMMEPCTQLLHFCVWLGTRMPCNQLFRVSSSAEGFCCSFNYKPPLDPLQV